MCTGAEALMIGGTLAQGVSAYGYSRAQSAQAQADAAGERDAAQQQAERILRATNKRRSEARAATAASGAKVDQFALGVEQDILQAGETDAAMTILSGERRARGLENSGRLARAAGNTQLASSLFTAGAYGMSGWKGAKQAPAPVEDRSFSYSSQDYRPNRAGR